MLFFWKNAKWNISQFLQKYVALKDHMTLKTGAMILKFSFAWQEHMTLYILVIFHNITALMSIINFFQSI